MATLVVAAMVAGSGLTAAATVGGPALSAPGATSDGTNLWAVAVGGSVPTGNIYYKDVTTGGSAGAWSGPIGTGSNPCIVYIGTGSGATANLDVFWVQNGAIVGKTTTNGGGSWSSITLPTTSVAAGTGPAAVYNPTNGQLDLFYVQSGTNNLVWVGLLANAITLNSNLGGQVYATPAAALTTDGNTVQVIVKGGSSRIYEATIFAQGFDGWTKFHDGLIGPGAAMWTEGTGVMYLFVAGTNSRVYVAASPDGGLTWYKAYDIAASLGATYTQSHSNLWWGQTGGITHLAPIAASATGAQPAGALPASVLVAGTDGQVWGYTANTLTPGPAPNWYSFAGNTWTVATVGP